MEILNPVPIIFTRESFPSCYCGKEEDFLNFLRSPERVFCLIRIEIFQNLSAWGGRPEVQVIARRGFEKNDIILISNR